MRSSLAVVMVGLALVGCRRGVEDTGHMHHVEVDLERIEEIADIYAKYEDINLLLQETITDMNGCVGPRWQNTIMYAYHPQNLHGMGVHFIDITYPMDSYDEEIVRIVLYDLNDKGEYELAGLEWYFEPPNGEALDETPTVFGIPMDGIMPGHTPEQGYHYDIHGWFYKTHPDNQHGYFNEFNPGMRAPDWYYDAEPVLLDAFKFYDPTVAPALGYTTVGDCISTEAGDAGIPITNDSLVGLADPFQPDTLLVDVNHLPMAIQWTVPDDGSGAPEPLLGQDWTLEDGNYVLRLWQGFRTNPLGMFGVTNPAFSCEEPQLPPQCMPGR